jgi:hypothetical protein
MSHPLGAQVWGANLGDPPEDSWLGFVALEGYPVCPDDKTSASEEIREPLSRDVMSKLGDVEVSSAMMAGGSLPRLDSDDVQTLLRLSRDDKQPGSLGDWIEVHINRIRGELKQADEQGKRKLEPLLDKLGEAKKHADTERNERARKFRERCRNGHTGHELVFAERVARIVRDMNVKAVVLTTCRGGVRGVSRWSGLAAELLRAGVPVVVAMQFAISVEAAKEFSYGFYDALAQEQSIDEAVAAGRARLDKTGFDDFGLPVIYSRLPQTVSLTLDDINPRL